MEALGDSVAVIQHKVEQDFGASRGHAEADLEAAIGNEMPRLARPWAEEGRARGGARPDARPWPGKPGHFIANGGFKIGFGMAARCAEVLLDLVLDDRDTIPESFHTNALS